MFFYLSITFFLLSLPSARSLPPFLSTFSFPSYPLPTSRSSAFFTCTIFPSTLLSFSHLLPSLLSLSLPLLYYQSLNIPLHHSTFFSTFPLPLRPFHFQFLLQSYRFLYSLTFFFFTSVLPLHHSLLLHSHSLIIIPFFISCHSSSYLTP